MSYPSSIVSLFWAAVLSGCSAGRVPQAAESSPLEPPGLKAGPGAEVRRPPEADLRAGGEGLTGSTPDLPEAAIPKNERGTPAQHSPLPVPAGTKVLHVGDSFAGALGLPLGTKLKEEGVSSVLKHTDASYLTDWAWDGQLQKMIWRYNPDLVLITLGGNELEIVQPERRERTVKKIVSLVGERPCVWIGVPLWKGPQNGLLDVIEGSCEPCVYLDTSKLIDLSQMERMKDGIHPTTSARARWADAVFGWLQRHRANDGERPWTVVP